MTRWTFRLAVRKARRDRFYRLRALIDWLRDSGPPPPSDGAR